MIKEKVHSFVDFKMFPNYFEAIVSSDGRTIHCEIGVWAYICKSFEDLESCVLFGKINFVP